MVITGLLLASCGVKPYKSNSQPVSHAKWDVLLQKHVSEDGKVNYQGFKDDIVALEAYLEVLSASHPNKQNWTKDERLAYWINAYNAFTVKLIVDNYPVKSIKELGGAIYKVNTPWDIKFIYIEGQNYDLNNIEHGIIRKQFNEPRIHFAVNCASVSCPNLSNRAYAGDKLDEQLTAATKSFLSNESKNQISATSPKVSKIFSWFRGDFKKGNRSVINFINEYAPSQINKDANLGYLDYSWELNE